MFHFTVDYELLYKELVVRVTSIGYTSFEAATKLNIHQTINLIIYQLQLILGEVPCPVTPGHPGRWLKKYRDLYWSFNGIEYDKLNFDFTSESLGVLSFHRDKKILVDKLRKLMLHPKNKNLVDHFQYGPLSKEESIILIFRMIDYYIKPFEFMHLSA